MKARKVFVTLEVKTDLSLAELRSVGFWDHRFVKVSQVQVNVARPEKPAKKKVRPLATKRKPSKARG